MQRETTNTILFLLVTIISSNLHPSRCSPLVDNDYESCDPYYEEIKQELSDEIDDVNGYMQMVADQLTNDGVIVVRAVKTAITTPDMENISKSETLALEGAGDSECDQSKETQSLETIVASKTYIESLCDDENISSIDEELKEMKQTSFEMRRSPIKFENLTLDCVEAKIIIP